MLHVKFQAYGCALLDFDPEVQVILVFPSCLCWFHCFLLHFNLLNTYDVTNFGLQVGKIQIPKLTIIFYVLLLMTFVTETAINSNTFKIYVYCEFLQLPLLKTTLQLKGYFSSIWSSNSTSGHISKKTKTKANH